MFVQAIMLLGTALAAYPATKVDPVTDTQAAEQIVDPYRWLEAGIRTDPNVQAWVNSENDFTEAYLASLPIRKVMKDRFRTFWNFERFGVPRTRGALTFFEHNNGMQNQNVLMVQSAADAAPRVLVDTNGWSGDGATAIHKWEPSPDGRYVALTIIDGGSDWRTVRIVEVATGKLLPDAMKWGKFTNISWRGDGAGVYYSRFPQPSSDARYSSVSLNHAVYFHRIGDLQSADTMVYATPDRPDLLHQQAVTKDGRYLLIFSAPGTPDESEVAIQDLRDAAAKPRILSPGIDYVHDLVGSVGDTLYFVTNQGASNSRIVAVDATAASPAPMREIVPEADKIESASLVGNRLIVNYLKDAHSVIRMFDLAGRPLGEVALPGLGSVRGMDGAPDDSDTYFSFQNFVTPPTIFRLAVATGRTTPFATAKTPFDPHDFVVRQQFYTSRDGTRVPMFICYKKGALRKGGTPTLLYGYGGYNFTMPPTFQVPPLAWMDMGGVYVLANIRGGGEYGAAWHDAGRLMNKQRSHDDFIAAAEYLQKTGITTAGQLAIEGESNGGLLVGAVVNRRPDLFAAALPDIGIMDMLRYNQFTAGRFWVPEFGDPADPAFHAYIRSYSPYHNIHNGRRYPAILVTTADMDDRVIPGHSFKYTAALQAAKIGDAPHMIRVENRAGHSTGKPVGKIIDEVGDRWAFAAHATGLDHPASSFPPHAR